MNLRRIATIGFSAFILLSVCVQQLPVGDIGVPRAYATHREFDFQVDTLTATNVDIDHARFRGKVSETDGERVTMFFVYGTDRYYLDKRTTLKKTTKKSGVFTKVVSGLERDRRYYYRACIREKSETDDDHAVCGSVRNFYTEKDYYRSPITRPYDDDDDDDGYSNRGFEVRTLSATNIDDDRATLRGRIEEADDDVRRYFEIGTSRSDLSDTVRLSGTTNNTGTFSLTVRGLDDNRRYYYRACIEEYNGSGDDCGAIEDFHTDRYGSSGSSSSSSYLRVETRAATSVTRNSARLQARITDIDNDVRRLFEVGLNASDLSAVVRLSGREDTTGSYSVRITGLQSGRVYYYRACIEDYYDSGERDCGSVRSVRTSGTSSSSSYYDDNTYYDPSSDDGFLFVD